MCLRVALLVCEDAPKWKGIGEQLNANAFGQPGDDFSVFQCPDGQFPAVEDVAQGESKVSARMGCKRKHAV